MKRGWYSRQAVLEGVPTSVWRSTTGKEVECTEVTTPKDTCKRPDAQNLGLVTEWVRLGMPGRGIYKDTP